MFEQPVEMILGVEIPFNLEYTVRALQRRPNNKVDIWDGGRYYRVLPTPSGNRLVTVEMMRPAEITQLKVQIQGGAVPDEAAQRIAGLLSYMLSINVDLSAFYQIAKTDEELRGPIQALCGLKPPRFPTLFETFVNVVVFQQISLEAGVAIHGRLVERYGHPIALDGKVYRAFPDPYDIAGASSEELRALGLSTRKADVLKDLANRAISGELDLLDLYRLNSNEAIERLMRLPGIGRWSAELVLLRGLGRLDVFPGGDVGARKNMARLLGVQGSLNPDEEQRILARYGHCKGYLYFCALIWGGIQTGVFPPVPPAEGCF